MQLFSNGNRSERKKGEPLSRQYVNSVMGHIKTIFSWGVENQIVPDSVAAALRDVNALTRSDIEKIHAKTPSVQWREAPRVQTVDDAVVDATLSFWLIRRWLVLPPRMHSNRRCAIMAGLPSERQGPAELIPEP